MTTANNKVRLCGKIADGGHMENMANKLFAVRISNLQSNGRDRSRIQVDLSANPEGGPQIRPLRTMKCDYVEKNTDPQ